MSNVAENLPGDLARFLGPAAAAEWRTFLGHLDLHRGFGVFLLLLPARAGASLCEGVLRQRLLNGGRELAVLRFETSERISELPRWLLENQSLSSAGAVWVDLLGAVLREDPSWEAAVRRALSALNQHRNRLAKHLSVPLIFVGEPWLQNALREAAPDLWTVRVAVERLDDTLGGSPRENLPNSDIPPREIASHSEGGAADPDYALEQARKLPAHPELLNQRAELLLRAASGYYRQRRHELAEAAAVECLKLLAGSRQNPALVAHANHLLAEARSGLGRRADALAPAQEAVHLFHALARQQPEAFTPDLAMSLNSLASRLSEMGRRADTLTLAQEALDLYRALARQQPDTFTPGLASSLANLAVVLGEMGRRADALTPAQESVDLYRALARERPDAFTPGLAMSLNNLATFLGEMGRRADALTPAQEAAGLYRSLARQHPEAFTPGLAMSLNNLASRLNELGRRAEALAPAQESVELRRALARQQPDAFTQGLAKSLNNLATVLSELGRRAEALVPAQEAVDLCRALARQQPEAYTPDLVMSLGMMGAVLEANERREEALACFREGVSVLTPLFEATPAAHAPLMQKLTTNYLRLAKALGQQPDLALLAPVEEVFQRMQPAGG